MAGLPKPPLTEKDYSKINEQLTRLAHAQTEIDRAMQAGITCDEFDAECKARANFLTAVKRAYFPEMP